MFCGFLAVQSATAAVVLGMYLRTYVARAVLDPRGSHLSLVCCSFFGEPSAAEHHLPLAMLHPEPHVTEDYIKFRLQGSPLHPACWVWYRMPRAPKGGLEARARGAQVGTAVVSSTDAGNRLVSSSEQR